MSCIKYFRELSKTDTHLAGGKGASLGEMTQAGIPVPPGFVILSTAFDQFLAETDLGVEIESILRTVHPEAIHTVEHASETIKALILSAAMPADITQAITGAFTALDATYVAVRSSATAEDGATAAWAGQLESYLNTTEEHLLENVKKCWASLFTPRAIFYRFEKGLHESPISVAVVVQTMVQSDIAGIAFSVHPVTEDRNQIIIEAGYGLGEAIVSGQITPDSYVVEKQPRRIVDVNVAEQQRGLYRGVRDNEWQPIEPEKQAAQKLTEQQILFLTDLILKIEQHYGFPCDIEWAFQNEEFYIVQSRPITTLSFIKTSSRVLYEKVEYMEQVYPLDLYMFNFAWSEAVKRPDLNLSSFEFLLDFHGNSATLYCDGEKYDKLVDRVLSLLVQSPEFRERLRAKHHQFLGMMNAFSKKLSTVNSQSDVLSLHTEFQQILYHNSFEFIEENAVSLHSKKLANELARIVGSAEAVSEVLYPDDISQFQKYELGLLGLCVKVKHRRVLSQDIASTLSGDIETFLAEFAWIGAGFNQSPKTVGHIIAEIQVILSTGKDPEEIRSERLNQIKTIASARDSRLSELSTRLSKEDYVFVQMARQLTNQIQKRIEEILALVYEARVIYTTIANQLKVPVETVKYLLPDEVSETIKNNTIEKYQDSIEERKKRIIIQMIDGKTNLLKEFTPPETPHSDALSGLSAYPGVVQGTVRIVHSSADNDIVMSGDILVSSRTSPELVPAMRHAAAIISEFGGLLCHAAIVSREMKKPCIVGVKNATKILKDGDMVEVDANSGMVRVLS